MLAEKMARRASYSGKSIAVYGAIMLYCRGGLDVSPPTLSGIHPPSARRRIFR